MRNKAKNLTYGALIAAVYVTLAHLQNFLLPGSASAMIQVRIAEVLCIFAFFTPAAIPGLTLGTLLFNLTFAQALPLDFLLGSLATLLATVCMHKSRNCTCKGYPLFGLLMPGLFNALIVGWELSIYIGGGFWFNAATVAIGEVTVLLSLGTALYYALRIRGLDKKLFG